MKSKIVCFWFMRSWTAATFCEWRKCIQRILYIVTIIIITKSGGIMNTSSLEVCIEVNRNATTYSIPHRSRIFDTINEIKYKKNAVTIRGLNKRPVKAAAIFVTCPPKQHDHIGITAKYCQPDDNTCIQQVSLF